MDVDDAASGKLASFLALAKSARGLAAASVIAEATAAPGLFAFGELLDMPHIQELEGTAQAPSLALLRLFAFGTLADYTAAAGALPALSPPQLLKLRQLTVASLAADVQSVPYAQLVAALDMPLPPDGSVRVLEDFLINECLTQGVLRGKLDQAKQALHVTWSLARDVPPVSATGTGAADSRVAAMAARLTAWSTAADGVLARLQAATQATSAADKQGKAAAADLASRIEAAKAAVASQADARGGGGGMGGFMRAGGAGSMLLDLSADERDGIGPHDMPHLAALGPASQGGFGMDDERVPAGRTKRRR